MDDLLTPPLIPPRGDSALSPGAVLPAPEAMFRWTPAEIIGPPLSLSVGFVDRRSQSPICGAQRVKRGKRGEGINKQVKGIGMDGETWNLN